MSFLSLAVSAALEDLQLTQTALATTAALTLSQVNRAARGNKSVGIETAVRLARAVPDPHRAAILIGWLKDQTPPDMRDLINIEPQAIATREDTTIELPDTVNTDTRKLIHWVVNEAINATAIADSIRSLRRAVEYAAKPRG